MRRGQPGDRADPARGRPQQRDGPAAEHEDNEARHRGAQRPHHRAPGRRHAGRQQRFRQVAQTLAENHVDRLHRQRVQRPEAALCQAQRPPSAEPADGGQGRQQQRRPELGEDVRRLVPDRYRPGVATSGAAPSSSAGTSSRTIQTASSLGRLISANRLPASDNRDR